MSIGRALRIAGPLAADRDLDAAHERLERRRLERRSSTRAATLRNAGPATPPAGGVS